MARKNPKVVALEKELADVRRDFRYEKEARLKAEGKVEHFEEQKQRERDDQVSVIHGLEREQRHLEDQVAWLRRLVENLCVPKDKLKLIRESQEQVRIEGPKHYPY